MRIKTELWIKAYVRRMAAQGAFATVARRGDEDFGAVLVLLRHLDGRASLFGPAPRVSLSDADDAAVDERRFIRLHDPETVSESDAEALLDRQRRFDADAWVVEIEDRHGRHDLDLAPRFG